MRKGIAALFGLFVLAGAVSANLAVSANQIYEGNAVTVNFECQQGHTCYIWRDGVLIGSAVGDSYGTGYVVDSNPPLGYHEYTWQGDINFLDPAGTYIDKTVVTVLPFDADYLGGFTAANFWDAIFSEASTRASADSVLQTNIDNEAATREAADSAEASARIAADDAEAVARAGGDQQIRDDLTSGTLVPAHSLYADEAGHAGTSDYADTAGYAYSSGYASVAGYAYVSGYANIAGFAYQAGNADRLDGWHGWQYRAYTDARVSEERDRAISEEQRIESESKARDEVLDDKIDYVSENAGKGLTQWIERVEGRVVKLESVIFTTEPYKQFNDYCGLYERPRARNTGEINQIDVPTTQFNLTYDALDKIVAGKPTGLTVENCFYVPREIYWNTDYDFNGNNQAEAGENVLMCVAEPKLDAELEKYPCAITNATIGNDKHFLVINKGATERELTIERYDWKESIGEAVSGNYTWNYREYMCRQSGGHDKAYCG